MKIKIKEQFFDVYDAKKMHERLIGLMFNKNKERFLFFRNCNAIHTWFMLYSIDILMVNNEYEVVAIFRDVKPWRVVSAKAKHTFEFKTGLLNIDIGDRIEIIE